ncbi:hypothetical protein TWF788_002182 [Orbilia oligospora]|uniref:DUF1308 domain-containing protein n=1 Tax=Orbilia oligospora TaxID=2813651 RepID=A0A7C8PCP2_ORBOL|nr:hypothetical protein TWF788_002182 [Orbilia oligospora]
MEVNTTASTAIPKTISCDDIPSSPSSPSSPTSNSASKIPNPLADELLARCLKVSDEITLLEKKLLQRLPPKQRSKKGNLPIELRHFKNAILVEQRLLENLSYSPPTPKTQHSLRSSNLKFLESVWSIAKTCSGLQVIFRTVQLFDHPTDNAAKLRGKEKKELKRKKTPVQVDIIAQNGLEWIKVAGLSEKRLETEFAKARWEAEGFKDEDDEDGQSENGDKLDHEENGGKDINQTILEFQHDSDAFSLVKSARSMVLAAQQTRVQYLHPEITIVLPNIHYDPQNPQLGSATHTLITAILSTGARVQTSNRNIISPTPPPGDESTLTDNFGNAITNRSQSLHPNHPPLASSSSSSTQTSPESVAEAALTSLSITSDPITLITPKILLDCTILLALVSDLSHDIEGREMICTFDAYKRFKEIVDIVGSESEKLRANALVWGGTGRDWRHPSPSKLPLKSGSNIINGGNKDTGITFTEDGEPLLPDGRTRTSLLSTLQSLSRHQVPKTLKLPITVVDSLESQIMSHNPVAAKIGPELSVVNRSSLFTAWEMGITIVTTNGSVVKRLEWLVEENRIRDDDVGPKVHLLAIARSLVGKMKKGTDILVEG